LFCRATCDGRQAFLDTGILVGALLEKHPEHAACREALEESDHPFTNAHALAEPGKMGGEKYRNLD
jgi:hypothetical protein